MFLCYDMRGHQHSEPHLRKMQEAAWAANKGRPRSEETKKKISEARVALQIAAGVPFCDILQRPMFKKDGHWHVFLDGKKVPRGKALYERQHGLVPKGWVVHHIDGNKENDSVNNLIPLSRADHYLLHLYWSAVSDWLGTKMNGVEVLAKFKQWKRGSH